MAVLLLPCPAAQLAASCLPFSRPLQVALLTLKTAAKPLASRFEGFVMNHPVARRKVIEMAQVGRAGRGMVGQSSPGQGSARQGGPAQGKAAHRSAGQHSTGQVRSGQVRSGQVRSGSTVARNF